MEVAAWQRSPTLIGGAELPLRPYFLSRKEYPIAVPRRFTYCHFATRE
jgi:hypothetical protein